MVCLPSWSCWSNWAVPVLTVDDLQVHVDPGDEHLTVDADLVEGGRGQGVGHRHHTHDLIGHRAAVSQRHPDAQAACDVDHLRGDRWAWSHMLGPAGRPWTHLVS